MQQASHIEISLQELVRFILRGLIPALATALVVGLGVYFLSNQIAPTFEAEATILAEQTDVRGDAFGVAPTTVSVLDVSAYHKAASSAPVVIDAMTSLGIEDASTEVVDAFRESISVETEPARDSSLVIIRLLSDSGEEAASRTNALAQALIDWDRARATDNLDRIISTLEQQTALLTQQIGAFQVNGAPEGQIQERIDNLSEQQDQLFYARTLRNSAVGRLRLLEPALVPTVPVAPRPALNAAIASFLSLLAVYGLLLLRNALDTRLKNVEVVERISGLPSLAEFPKAPPGNMHLPIEIADYLRTNVLFATDSSRTRIILVTSANAGEGKSRVALNLAESFAKSNHTTLLIDADLRRPKVSQSYNIDPTRAITLQQYLEEPNKPFVPAKVPLRTPYELFIVPSFEPAPAPTDLLSLGFRERLDEWRTQYDIIVIDAAPILPVADTLTIAPLCTDVLLSISLDHSRQRDIRMAVDTLQRIGVTLLGTVATDVKASQKNNDYLAPLNSLPATTSSWQKVDDSL